jgi:hypothetical protein
MISFRMTGEEIAACSDQELQAIVRMARETGARFQIEADLARHEMGKRVAREVFTQAQRDRAKARVRMCK